MTHRVAADRRARAVRFASILCAIAGTSPAKAQTERPERQIESSPALVATDAEDIIVTARYGAAAVEPETELSEDAIALYGADSIRELIQKIKPLIDGSGREPVLLVNGKRVGSAAGIGSFPPEALNRLEILPPKAAARYGYPSSQRVVNLALKKHFVSWNAETGVTSPTAGGRDSERLVAGRVAIDGPTHWNAQIQISRDDALLKSERRTPRHLVDVTGHVEAMVAGEIDPALSLLAGTRVSVAGIPAGATSHPPALADFAETAGTVRLGDAGAFETLLPSGHSIAFNAGIARPLGSLSASFNINAGRSWSRQLLGLPTIDIMVPAGSPWSPFGSSVMLVRNFDGDRALRNDQRSDTLGLSVLLSGAFGSWQTTLAANYTRGWSDTRFERGIDQVRVQERVDLRDPSFNPYGPWPGSLLLTERNRSRSDSLNVRLNITRAILTLPAGELLGNFAATAGRNGSVNDRAEGIDAAEQTNVRQSRFTVMQSLSIPIASRSADVLAPLGDLSVDLSASVQGGTNPGLRPQLTGSLNWSPFTFLQFSGSYGYEEVVPSVEQLNGPRVEVIRRLYDFAREEMAEPVWVTGGNPDLREGSRQSISLNGMVRPLGSQLVTINIGYQRLVSAGGVGTFPAFTPTVEAIFPERITRDVSGRLVMVDARPITISRDVSEQLTTSLVLLISATRSRPVGTAAPGPATLRTTVDDPWQVNLSLSHSWQLRSELVTHPGFPALDRLGGDGGQPRHNVSLQLVAGKRGIGATLSGTWQSAARVSSDPGGQGDFRYPAMTQFGLGMFVEPDRLWAGERGKGWLGNLRLSIDIENLLGSYRKVLLNDGSVPDGFSRDEIDPLGRTIRMAVRKRF